MSLALLASAAGCTPDDPAPTPPPAGPSAGLLTAPVNQFPPVSTGDATGARIRYNDVAATENEAVTVGQYSIGLDRATFGYSPDGGTTWQPGAAPVPDRAVDERADRLAVRTVDGTSTWLATGVSGRQLASWSSADGKSWQQHLFGQDNADAETDTIYDLVASESGFVAAGRSAVGTDIGQPRVWTSPDGASWATHRLPGTGAVTGVAARGNTLVAVGQTSDDWLVWRSRDRGAHWAKIPKIPRPSTDGDFNRSFADVAVHGAEFVAIGSFFNQADKYQPMIYRSRDGVTWTADGTSEPLTRSKDSFGQQLVSQGDQMMAVVESNGTLRQDKVYQWVDGGWWPTIDPAEDDGKAEWAYRGMARSRAGWLAAASRELNAAIEPHLWLTRKPRIFTEVAAAPPPSDLPRIDAQSVAHWAGAWRVFGQARDQHVLWTQGSDGTFGAPQPVSIGANAAVEGVVGDDEAMLAYGVTNGGNADHATTWLSTDGKIFTASAPNTFEKVYRYSYSSIHDMAKIGRTWFAVGERSSNGGLNVSALIYTSADGQHWTAGKAADTITKAKGDVWYDVTDLAGDHDRKRSMNDVVGTALDLLAVGSTEENGPAQATVWHSRSGTTWESSVIGARGYERSEITNAASIGRRTVLSGWAAHRGESETTPYVWWSDNGGRTWRGRAVAHRGEGIGQLVATESAFVVTGTTRAEVNTPWFQQSTDGEHWRPLTVTGYDTAGGSAAYVSDLKTEGRDLISLITVENLAGSGSVLVRQMVR